MAEIDARETSYGTSKVARILTVLRVVNFWKLEACHKQHNTYTFVQFLDILLRRHSICACRVV